MGGGEAISFPSRLRISQWARSLLRRRRRLLEIPPPSNTTDTCPLSPRSQSQGRNVFPGETPMPLLPRLQTGGEQNTLSRARTRGEAYFPELDADAIIIWGGEAKGLSWGKGGRACWDVHEQIQTTGPISSTLNGHWKGGPPFFSCGGSSGRLLL